MRPLSEGGRRMLEIMKEVFTRRHAHESTIERADMLDVIHALRARQPQGSQTDVAVANLRKAMRQVYEKGPRDD